jgi:hypothetical protein
MARKVYHVRLIGEIDIDLDDEVIKAGASDDFKSIFGYNMKPDEVAQHLAYSKVVMGANLENLDGFADQPNMNMKILSDVWRMENTEE